MNLQDEFFIYKITTKQRKTTVTMAIIPEVKGVSLVKAIALLSAHMRRISKEPYIEVENASMSSVEYVIKISNLSLIEVPSPSILGEYLASLHNQNQILGDIPYFLETKRSLIPLNKGTMRITSRTSDYTMEVHQALSFLQISSVEGGKEFMDTYMLAVEKKVSYSPYITRSIRKRT